MRGDGLGFVTAAGAIETELSDLVEGPRRPMTWQECGEVMNVAERIVKLGYKLKDRCFTESQRFHVEDLEARAVENDVTERNTNDAS